jgi:hypothetical protein
LCFFLRIFLRRFFSTEPISAFRPRLVSPCQAPAAGRRAR